MTLTLKSDGVNPESKILRKLSTTLKCNNLTCVSLGDGRFHLPAAQASLGTSDNSHPTHR